MHMIQNEGPDESPQLGPAFDDFIRRFNQGEFELGYDPDTKKGANNRIAGNSPNPFNSPKGVEPASPLLPRYIDKYLRHVERGGKADEFEDTGEGDNAQTPHRHKNPQVPYAPNTAGENKMSNQPATGDRNETFKPTRDLGPLPDDPTTDEECQDFLTRFSEERAFGQSPATEISNNGFIIKDPMRYTEKDAPPGLQRRLPSSSDSSDPERAQETRYAPISESMLDDCITACMRRLHFGETLTEQFITSLIMDTQMARLYTPSSRRDYALGRLRLFDIHDFYVAIEQNSLFLNRRAIVRAEQGEDGTVLDANRLIFKNAQTLLEILGTIIVQTEKKQHKN